MIALHKSALTALFTTIIYFAVFAQERSYDELKGAEIKVYKTANDFDLKLNIIYPKEYKKGKKYPAIIFFFGGGWKSGNVHQFEQQCHFLAKRGLIAMAANYRVSSRNNSTPFDAVEDAKSAMRYIIKHAKDLGINKNKIVAAGGSAGGHLAAATAIIPGFDAEGENPKVKTKPSALILFNPVINTTEQGYGSERLGDKARSISPAHHVIPKLPPTLIFHGLADKIVPYQNVEDFQSKMESAGNVCYVVPFSEMGHGFFNYGRNDNKYYELTMEKTEAFLRELKYIK
jgi:acetyl esterase/lipase